MPTSKYNTARFLLFIFFIVFCLYFSQRISLTYEQIHEMLNHFPVFLSGIIYIFVYVCITFFIWFVAKDVLRIAAALFFGGLISSILIYIAEIINAFILFYLARSLGQKFIQEHFGVKQEIFKRAKRLPSFWGSFIMRINPIFPFRFLDLSFGLSTITLKKYMLSVVAGSFVRIYLEQFVLAEVGRKVLTDFPSLIHYFKNNSYVVTFGFAYLSFVVVATVIYGSMKTLKGNK